MKILASISWLRVFAVMAKEFTQLRRDRVTYAMMLILPLMQLLLLGYAINNDPHHLPAAVLAQDRGNMANALVSALERTEYLDVRYLPDSEAKLDRLLRQGKALFGITIPPDFSARLLKGDRPQILLEADASDPVSVSGVLSALPQLAQEALKYELRGSAGGPNTQSSRPDLQLQAGTVSGGLAANNGGAPFEVVVHRRYNPENITSYNIVPGLLGIVLSLTLVMMTALAVTRERERGTMESLLATPATPLEVMVGKLTPYIIVGIVQTCVVLFLARLLFGVPMADTVASWLALLLGILLFIVGNLSLGYLISTVAKSQLQAMQLSFFYILPSIFLSGFAFPFYGMPGWARLLGEALPITHFLRIVRGALLKQQTLADMSQDTGILLVFVLAISALAVLRSKTTLD